MVWRFAKAVFKHWLALLGGGIFTVVGIVLDLTNQSKLLSVSSEIVAAFALIAALYKAWAEQARELDALKTKLTQPEDAVAPALVLEIQQQGTEGGVAIRNIGEHPAFDVQVQPVPKSDGGFGHFDRIGAIERGGRKTVQGAVETAHFPSDVFTVMAFYNIARAENITVTCRSNSNSLHTFKFALKKSKSGGPPYFLMMEHQVSPAAVQ